MKKKITVIGVLTIVLIMAVGFTGCGGSGGDSKADYTMKISVAPPDTNPVAKGVIYLAKQIEEKSGGKIKTEVYTGYELTSSDQDQADYVQKNTIQMSVATTSTMVGLADGVENWYIFDYPYLFDGVDQVYDFTDNSDYYKDMCATLLEKTGIKAYAPYSQGEVKISSSKKEIKSPKDLAGLKIRTSTSELYQKMVKCWGASPTPMSWGEVFTGLQQGTIDGVVTSTSMYDSDNLYEVQDYMGVVNPFPLLHAPMLNNQWFESLPKDLQKVVDDCMKEYLTYERDLQAKAEEAIKEDMKKNGMTVTEYSDEEMKAFIEPCKSIIDDYASLAGKDFVMKVVDYLDKK